MILRNTSLLTELAGCPSTPRARRSSREAAARPPCPCQVIPQIVMPLKQALVTRDPKTVVRTGGSGSGVRTPSHSNYCPG